MPRRRRPSKQMLALLDAFLRQRSEWRHGYDLMIETGLKSGTLYPLLIRMADAGFIEAEWRDPTAPGRPARHAYRLTSAGLSLALAEADNRVSTTTGLSPA